MPPHNCFFKVSAYFVDDPVEVFSARFQVAKDHLFLLLVWLVHEVDET